MSIIFKRTKILATIGPSSWEPEMIEALVQAGANGFRFNFSHGSYEEKLAQIGHIREASAKIGKPVAILQDLQGPKIRLGNLEHNTPVKTGDELILDYAAEHDGLVLPVQYNLAEKVKVGEPLYIFDGKIKTEVIEKVSDTAIKVRVGNPGILMSRKGINLPDTDFSGDILTPKDIKDIEFGADKDIDYVALSFVQSADDIHDLRQRLRKLGSQALIVAKIETKAAIEDDQVLEGIIEASDGVMIARGDLAVEAGAEVVPIVQRKIIALCREHGKLSIVATQMMASMVDNPEPTRAEVGDVATAVILGADTVMLSDETANGSYPLETVEAMKKVIMYTQQHASVTPLESIVHGANPRVAAITAAAVSMAEQMEVDAIVAETKSGATAASVASQRPHLPIISVTSEMRTAQQLALWYANKSFLRPDSKEAGANLASELKAQGFFGDRSKVKVAIISGHKPGVAGLTDTIRFQVIE
jgi:pyruvate kinase